jgi:P4 family phage/plasmid primase-like protien
MNPIIKAEKLEIQVVEKENKIKLHTKSTDKEITEALKEKLGNVLYIPTSDDFYVYDGKIWKKLDSKARIKSEALKILETIDNGQKATQSKASQISAHLELISLIEMEREINDKRDYLILDNCILDIGSKTFNLISHTPKIYNTNMFKTSLSIDELDRVNDINYNPLDNAPILKKYFEDTFFNAYYEEPQETLDLIQEMMGYCLTSHTKAQKAFFLWGSGQDGKSVICDVLTGLLGKENTSSLTFESFNKEFYNSDLIGKTASISAESKRMRFKEDANTGVFKAIVAGDRITINIKGKPLVSYKPFAKLIFAVNHCPEVPDNSHGFARRVLNIPFTRQVPNDEVNVNLANDILEKEFKQVFLFALQGLKRLQDRNYRFRPSKDIEKATNAYLKVIDPIQDFIKNNLIVNENAKIRTDRLRELYSDYMELNNLSGELNINAIGREIVNKLRKEKVRKKRLTINGDRPYYYVGIGEKST